MIPQRRIGAFSLISRLVTIVLVTAGLVLATQVTAAQAGVQTAISTTTNIGYDQSPGNGPCLTGQQDQDSVNCNQYSAKQDVWLSGLPTDLRDGDYFLSVMEPSGQNNPNDGAEGVLSTDTHVDRSFHVDGDGLVSALPGSTHVFSNGKVQLFPYDDTTNPGGVYILGVCALDDYPVTPSDCKYDAFKVQTGDDTEEEALPLTVFKDASGTFDKTWTWAVDKAADKTLVKKVGGGTADFEYTVTVTHGDPDIGNVAVTGTITVFNPNDDPVTGVDVTDQLSNGTVCSVTGGEDATAQPGDNEFAYACALSSRPEGQLDNTATATWPEQPVGDAVMPAYFADFVFTGISFEANLVDECTDVTDSYAGALGTVCVGEPNPTTFTYTRTVDVPTWECVSYDNTATFTTTDTGATGAASQTVTACGPKKTGARTMGFWQNNNGQGIIKNGTSTGGVCATATYLKTFNPFANMTATTCNQVAAYVYTTIKAANASGATMNAMLKGQMLATALDVWFTGDGAYAGAQAFLPSVPIGAASIDLTQVCKNIATCTIYENTGPAFGGASSMTVADLLAWASSQSNVGGSAWYGQVKAMQELAKDTFDAINNQVAFGG